MSWFSFVFTDFNMQTLTFNYTFHLLIFCALYRFLFKPLANLIYQIYYAHRFHYLPSHPIFGHLKDIIPKFPNLNYDLNDTAKNFYDLTMKSNDPVKGSEISVIWLGAFPLYCVSGASAIEAILSKSNLTKLFYYKFMGLGDGLVVSSPSKWRERRKLIENFFTTKQQKYFVRIMDKEISRLPGKIMGKLGLPYDINHLIHVSALNIIIEVCYSVPCEDHVDVKSSCIPLIDNIEALFAQRVYNPIFWFDGLFKRFQTGATFVKDHSALINILELYLSRDEENLKMNISHDREEKMFTLHELLRSNRATRINIDKKGIIDEVVTMVGAGHETVATSIRWTLFSLGNNDEIQDRLYQEIIETFPGDTPVDDLDKIAQCKYLDQCLKESLRLHPPVHVIGRKLDSDVTIGESKLLKDSLLLINFSATHRDPKFFPDPLKYDPDRWSLESGVTLPKGAFAPFSLGPRNCVGYRYALIEMKVYLIHIIRQFRLKSVRKPEQVDYRFELTLKPSCPLEIVFTLRK